MLAIKLHERCSAIEVSVLESYGCALYQTNVMKNGSELLVWAMCWWCVGNATAMFS